MALFLVGTLMPEPAAAKRSCTLKNKRTHFKVKAPCNFKLKYKKSSGVYTIYNKRVGAVAYTLVNSTATPAEAGAALVEQLRVTVLSKSETAKRYLATAKNERNGAQGTILVRRRGKKLATAIYNTLGKSASGKASAAANPLKVVQRIANRATGGRAVPLPVGKVQVQQQPRATEKYTTPDGQGTANTIVGWINGGLQGMLESVNMPGTPGYNPDNGTGEARFGIPAIVCTPAGAAYYPAEICRVTSNYVMVPDAVTLLSPIDALIGAEMSNLQVTQCNPQALVPGYDSTAICAFTFTRGGAAWMGAGFFATASQGMYDGQWLLYYSFIAALATDLQTANTLYNVWGSWDPSVGISKRWEQIQQTMNEMATLVSGFIHPAVFEKTSNNWDAYIRGEDIDLTPLSYGGGPLDG